MSDFNDDVFFNNVEVEGESVLRVFLAAAVSKNNLLWLINNAGIAQQAPAQAPKKEPESASFSEFTLNI